MPGGAKPATAENPELQAACQRVADVRCARFAECSPTYLGQFYGTEATCQAAVADECQTWLTIDGANSDPEGPSAVATQLEEMSCSEVLARRDRYWMEYSNLPGTKPQGADCDFDAQCGSLDCQISLARRCGTCGPAPSAQEHVGEPCYVVGDSSWCAVPGRFCEQVTKTCLPMPQLGDACADPESYPFGYCGDAGLECHEGVCGEPLGFGESCTTEDDKCSRAAQLACNERSVCDVATPAHVEGLCGGFIGTYPPCGYMDVCNRPNPESNDGPGNCEPKELLGFGDPCRTAGTSGLNGGCPSAMTCLDGICQGWPVVMTCE